MERERNPVSISLAPLSILVSERTQIVVVISHADASGPEYPSWRLTARRRAGATGGGKLWLSKLQLQRIFLRPRLRTYSSSDKNPQVLKGARLGHRAP